MTTQVPTNKTSVRVRYGEVDRMGVVYHGHYLVYFELGRTALLRACGVTYRDVEDAGTLLVVVDTRVKYERPARYDDLLTVKTRLVEVRRVRLRFEYELSRGPERLASGYTVLASTGADGRPKRLPPELGTSLLGADADGGCCG